MKTKRNLYLFFALLFLTGEVFLKRNAVALDTPVVTRITSPAPKDNGGFGRVAISGNRMIVASTVFDSKTYIYNLDTGAILHTITQNFINHVAIDGDFAVLGTSGSAFLFKMSTEEIIPLTPTSGTTTDSFGTAIAIHGNRVIIGDYNQDSGMIDKAGAFYVFDTQGNQLLHVTGTSEEEKLGSTVAINENKALIGAPGELLVDVGKVVVLDVATLTVEATPLVGDDTGNLDLFGDNIRGEVSISGNQAIVGVANTNAVYVFDVTTKNQIRKINAPPGGTLFGSDVQIDGNLVAVADPMESTNGPNRGVTHIYDVTDGSLQESFRAFDEDDQDFFGDSIAFNGRFLIVGVRFKDTEVAGLDHGAVYIYDFQPPSNSPVLKVKGKKTIRTSRSRLTIRGTASDVDGDLKLVQVKDARPRGKKKFRKAKGTTKWKYKAKLRSGRNRIKAFALDEDGNRSQVLKLKVIRR